MQSALKVVNQLIACLMPQGSDVDGQRRTRIGHQHVLIAIGTLRLAAASLRGALDTRP
jgi:hypothetical protein